MVRDEEVVTFLQWALPRMGLRWSGFRKVRGQVRKRLARRMTALGLHNLTAYRAWLEAHPEEWTAVDAACRISITRFYRDRHVWQFLESNLPAAPHLRAWCAGCAAGEEAYTLAILLRLAGQNFSIVVTDAEESQLQRARRACYPLGSLRELPPVWQTAAFEPDGCLRAEFSVGIAFTLQDIRQEMPAGPFHLIFCRNLAFTYFADDVQRGIAEGLRARLLPSGFLVLGIHESAPGFVRIVSGVSRPERLACAGT
jgi:chemotaxis protein methyltransferase CheR